MIPFVHIEVMLLPPKGTPGHDDTVPICGGFLPRPGDATSNNLDDAEANAIRQAEQLVRGAFAKFRERVAKSDFRPWHLHDNIKLDFTEEEEVQLKNTMLDDITTAQEAISETHPEEAINDQQESVS
jgi:hypothetical protein